MTKVVMTATETVQGSETAKLTKYLVLVAKPIHAGVYVEVQAESVGDAVKKLENSVVDMDALIQDAMVDVNWGRNLLILNDTEMIEEAKIIGDEYYQGLDLYGVYDETSFKAHRFKSITLKEAILL